MVPGLKIAAAPSIREFKDGVEELYEPQIYPTRFDGTEIKMQIVVKSCTDGHGYVAAKSPGRANAELTV